MAGESSIGLRWWEHPYRNVGFDRLDRDLLTGDGWSAAYYVSHSLNQYEITRRSGQTAGDRRRQICRLARKNQGVLWNSRLRRSNIIGHPLISWLASPESALLRSRRSVLPCEWFLFWVSLVRYTIESFTRFFSIALTIFLILFHMVPIFYLK